MSYEADAKPTEAPSARYQRHLARLQADPRARLRGGVAMPCVYFVGAEKLLLIKIGVTLDLGDRLKTLRVGSPDKLVLLGAIRDPDAIALEGRLHARFALHRSHGEWFAPCAELLALIEANSVEHYEDQCAEDLRSAMALAYPAA